MSFALRGIGTAVPDTQVSAADGLLIARKLAGPGVRDSGFLPAVYEGTGNRARYQVIGSRVMRDVVEGTRLSGSDFLPTDEPGCMGPTTGQRAGVYAEEAPSLALRAAKDAIKDCGFAPATISHLVTVSCTGFNAPGVDLALIRGLGLRPNVERTHVGFMGCHGALNGLRVAKAFVGADPSARVLLCAVELCSIHYHYGEEPEKMVANALFADGAAAVVGVADAEGRWRVAASGSYVVPDSADAMSWTIGDHGFEMTLARKVPALISASLRPWLEVWLADNGLSLDGIRSWAVHPGGPRILDAVEQSLDLPTDALAVSRGVFADYGNMSSPTVLFIVDALRKADAPLPCLSLGFGPGLAVEALLWR
jgi:alpha-pyrone synthase